MSTYLLHVAVRKSMRLFLRTKQCPVLYPVLQSTTPVLLCPTKYYKVLLRYYCVLQSTTPVLQCTTKYYSGTTVYYKVLLQYYSVLQSTTPVLVRILQRVYDGLMLFSSNFSVLKLRFSLLVISWQFIACDIICNDSW